MRGFFRYSAIAFALIAVVGCEQHEKEQQLGQNTWGDINVPLDPSQHYIHFDAGIATRGAIIEGKLLYDDFAVLGYQYPGTWSGEELFATPNVFDYTPQPVSYENGVFSYGTPKVWTGNRYSFFGVYPAKHENIKIWDGNGTKQGTPYITYTLPVDNDPTKLIDIMTAANIDTGIAESSYVDMEFHHRLSCIDVGARNYYKFDHDNSTLTPDKLVTIEIILLEVSLDNIVNTSAKIYLDPNIPTEYPQQQVRAQQLYKMVDKATSWAVNTFDVEPNSDEDIKIRLISKPSGENASSIILIPQKELVHGNVKLTYKKKYKDDNGNWVYLHEGENVNDFEFSPDGLALNFDKQLIETSRYYIELTFTSDAVSVNVVTAAMWDIIDKDNDGKADDIDHEFE